MKTLHFMSVFTGILLFPGIIVKPIPMKHQIWQGIDMEQVSNL